MYDSQKAKINNIQIKTPLDFNRNTDNEEIMYNMYPWKTQFSYIKVEFAGV